MLVVCILVDSPLTRAVPGPYNYGLLLVAAFLMAILFQMFLHLKDVYDFRVRPSSPEFLLRLSQALMLAFAVLWILYSVAPGLSATLHPGRTMLRMSALVTLWHVALRLYFENRPQRSNLLIMGTGRLARELVTEILRHPEYGFAVCGFMDHNPSLLGTSIVNPKVIGMPKDLCRVVSDNHVDEVVVELQDRRGNLPMEELLYVKTQGVKVEDAASLYERVTGKIYIQNLKPSWMIFNDGFEVSRRLLIYKRIFEFAVSSLLLIFSLPLLPLIALLIKLDSSGPIFHRQERVGQNGRIFAVRKFRSMRKDAELDTGPVWATAQDSRITRVGRYLRRTRLDELPQLYNVLNGDMSLVGPRPERPHFVEELTKVIPFYQLRHAMKPGVTGWSQIRYRYANTVEDAAEKLQYDLFYIKNISWFLDLLILFETVKTVLVRKGS